MDNIDYEGVFKGKRVVYFSMEIGINSEFSTYSGGLGILAGDTVRSSADLNIPLVAVTLVSKKGYFRQEFTPDGWQIEHSDVWEPDKHLILLSEQVEVEIEKRSVKIQAWLYVVKSTAGGQVPVIFLDTDLEVNAPKDREITAHLYGGDQRYRMKQEIVLGIGGLRMINALKINVLKYHLNEGHASFLLLDLLRNFGWNVESVKNLCVFTTHTPVEAGHDKFPYQLALEILPTVIPIDTIKEYAGQDSLNMTHLALNLSGFINGVAEKHRETTKKMFPGYEIRSITNGIHSLTWIHPALKKLYDEYIPGWAKEPELLVRTEFIPHEEIWESHYDAKKELIDYVNGKTGRDFSYDTFTIGFARRASTYKRHALLFQDLKRLLKINKQFPIQIIFAGKAHPKDEPGKKMIQEIFSYIEKLKNDVKIAYLENYNMDIAKILVPGVDVWLNTPMRPMEASGTSGMKAALNGVINFSVSDGWWVEGCIEGVTGWAIGPCLEGKLSDSEMAILEKQDLYGKLEYAILPMFYEHRDSWITIMKNSIGKIAYYFNSTRMMRHYITDAYFG
ncbi:MAG: alpha-glucan family phosphorylase [Candidatus Saelkia tenebricola]|nr:alpha-glucan family phosphorylase [Candidatus Saelkia tenebricola]